MLSTDTNVKIG